MNLEEVRELMHKLNFGVGKATSMETWKTKEIESPDGDLLGMERTNEQTNALGSLGTASPCCDAPGGEHTPECPVGRDGDSDDINRWLRNA